MQAVRLITSVHQLARRDGEVTVVGTGPAGTAMVERVYSQSKMPITILERGPVSLTTHFNNLFPNSERRRFINRNGRRPWLGTMAEGMLMMGLGGRGTVAGAHRPRFYVEDFDCFPEGRWPQAVINALPDLFSQAELNLTVTRGDISCSAQQWASSSLRKFRPVPPRISLDKSLGGFSSGRGYDSPAERLIKLVLLDSMSNEVPRLRIVTDCYVTRILHNGGRATAVCCLDMSRPNSGLVEIATEQLVLAASPIESTRIILNSWLGEERPTVGRFLAEHFERRCKIRVRIPGGTDPQDGISLIIPPCSGTADQRFQIHLRGEADPSDQRYAVVDIGGFAAMDPQYTNSVTLADTIDEFGIRKAQTHLSMTTADRIRERNMCLKIRDVVDELGGDYITEEFPSEGRAPQYIDESRKIEAMAPGRSYHESGTLRMGLSEADSACDIGGTLHGTENIHVADGSLFPCVGVANPILTVSALAYWVADCICRKVSPK